MASSTLLPPGDQTVVLGALSTDHRLLRTTINIRLLANTVSIQSQAAVAAEIFKFGSDNNFVN